MNAHTPESEAHFSALCLACGLCCNGILHPRAILRPEEIEPMRALGLAIDSAEGPPAFRLPCRLYRDERCSIYAARPHTCRVYRCSLLRKVQAGELRYEQAAGVIRRARGLLDELLAELPAGYGSAELQCSLDEEWDAGLAANDSDEMRREHAGFLLALGALVLHLRRYFEKPEER